MLGLRVRTATYFSTETSFKREIVRSGHWHTKPGNFSSADAYSDKPMGRSGRRDLVLWGSRGRMMAEHESLEGAELGSQPGLQGTPPCIFPLEARHLSLANILGSHYFLGHCLLRRDKTEKHAGLGGL